MFVYSRPAVFIYSRPIVFVYSRPAVFVYSRPGVFVYSRPTVFVYIGLLCLCKVGFRDVFITIIVIKSSLSPADGDVSGSS